MPLVVLKDYPLHLTKYESKGTSKIPIFRLYSELGKIWKCSLAFSKTRISHPFYELGKTRKYTQPKNNLSKSKLWICAWIRKNLWPNLSFTAENKMRNSHKKRWPHFKLNINDWDIQFPKILRTYQWIGKNIFHLEKMEWTHWELCLYHRIFG